MTAHVIVLERTIDATMSEVWDAITDLAHLEETRDGVSHVHRLDDEGGYAVGTRWTESRSLLGHHGTETCEVIEASPPHHTVIGSRAGRDRVTTSFALSDLTGKTRVAMTVRVDMSRRTPWGKLAWEAWGDLNYARSRRTLQHDLDRLADAAERAHLAA